ncbi:DEHA2D05522p [Debaryomyces hansenii CBS767]|uniref:L-lactate dehydrogenase (cytochrome) n=1 Tax=Debaryomyces hansenii (strain ATCC 36239 / CBS 767 / BCRC 21394 / JCM 1990 / NBRC 0083 / IGC 2968) TaxID=284592 RepID=B5RTR4_DEBHA|nr:DEHA2D05522p [Debaryomyces hansenii CBS767]CAR65620.1 DEHA2D05522p [Debaryomyces hansenii CBS767]|eukprot:XP_002770264.1 DEHA2D05522p [Debaryomyces hansenii CBS767]
MIDYEEVQKHNTKEDCWVIIHNKVYDVSDFVDEHPGGSAVILKYAGKNATKAFDPIHPPDTLTKYLAPKHHLGEVSKPPPKKQTKAAGGAKAPPPTPATTSGDSQVVDEFDVEYDEQDDKAPIPVSQVVQQEDEAEEEDEYDDDDDEPPTEEELNRRQMVKRKPDLGQIYNLNDFEFVARHTMEKVAWGYYSSGSDDEITLRDNHLSYQRILFKPRVMVDVTNIDLSTTMLGTKTSVPFYITATALGKLGHKDGEKVLTRSAAKQDVIQMIPTLASCSFDEIVDEATDKQTQWLQLYVNSDREICKGIVQHAEKRGIKGLFITVDAPQLGRREKDMRSKNVEDLSHVQGEGDDADRSQGAARAISSFIDTGLNWKDIKWFRSITKMPIILKGVQTVEDSLLAVEHGVDGIVLSNHGGRQLEYSKPPIELLAELMPILRKRNLHNKLEVYTDGGVRRASDILKAICLGAKGVGIGRPFLYAMSTYGDDGVVKAIQILKDEMIMNMRLLGTPTIDRLNENYVDTRTISRYVPEDKLFGKVYEPLVSPLFKDSKL